ncbi:hypothetical protein CB452P1_000010 [Clostridium phage CB452P1]|nr:hypothetical protein CB452P1_000010 [Clostridium phage CB452P1]
MNIYKTYCDLCGEIQSVHCDCSRMLNTLNIYMRKDDDKKIEAEICSKCKEKIKKQIEENINKITEKEKQN